MLKIAEEDEKPRSIRVFISSTFLDMQAEREQLVRHTFPLLRRHARERGVELTEIDLRWGITEERAHRGETIAVCLAEIERSRPYFVGLIGHRYGWVPLEPLPGESDEKRQERLALARRKLKLRDSHRSAIEMIDAGLSATEIEIQHGVLRSPEARLRARFYFRRQSPPEFCDPAESDAFRRLEELKLATRRRMASAPPHDFSSVQELHEAVLADFKGYLDEEYPLNEAPTALQSVHGAHRQFGRSRMGVWEGADKYLDQLDTLIDGGQTRILVSGEGGLGKSALLAHWIKRRQDFGEDVFYFFCGGGSGCSSWSGTLRLLLKTAIDYYSDRCTGVEIPTDDAKLGETLLDVLGRLGLGGDRSLTIVLDGLDQLTDAAELRRWPYSFPTGVRVVLSTRTEDLASSIVERGYESVKLAPLAPADRRLIIRKMLVQHAKEFDKTLLEEIVGDNLSGNPLVLRALLEELKNHGERNEITELARWYLGSGSPDRFFGRVIERVARDYPAASAVLPLLGAAVKGLSESELREAAGIDHLAWAELRAALAPHLVERDGLLGFFHDYIRSAVDAIYLQGEMGTAAQRRLAEYFLYDDRRHTEHALTEWPELLWRLRDAERLRRELLEPTDAEILADKNPANLRRWWMLAEPDADNLEALLGGILKKMEITSTVPSLEGFINTWVGRYKLIASREQLRLDWCIKELGPDHAGIITAKHNLANTYSDLGRHQEALCLQEQVLGESTCILGPDHPNTINAKLNLANTYSDLGRCQEALGLSEQVLADSIRILGPDHPDTIRAKWNLANTYSTLDRLQEALSLREQVLADYTRILGSEHPDTITAKNNLAASYSDLGRHQDALGLQEQILADYKRILGPDHPHTIMAKQNLAVTYSALGEHQKALGLNEQVLADRVCILGPDHPHTIMAKQNLSVTYSSLGRHQDALGLQEQILADRTRILGPDHPDTISANKYLARIKTIRFSRLIIAIAIYVIIGVLIGFTSGNMKGAIIGGTIGIIISSILILQLRKKRIF